MNIKSNDHNDMIRNTKSTININSISQNVTSLTKQLPYHRKKFLDRIQLYMWKVFKSKLTQSLKDDFHQVVAHLPIAKTENLLPPTHMNSSSTITYNSKGKKKKKPNKKINMTDKKLVITIPGYLKSFEIDNKSLLSTKVRISYCFLTVLLQLLTVSTSVQLLYYSSTICII